MIFRFERLIKCLCLDYFFITVFEKKTGSPSITEIIAMIPSLKRNVPKQYQNALFDKL